MEPPAWMSPQETQVSPVLVPDTQSGMNNCKYNDTKYQNYHPQNWWEATTATEDY